MPIDFAKYGGKNETSTKESGIKLDFSKYAEPVQPTYQEQQKKFGQVSVDPSKSKVAQIVNKYAADNPTEPTWNGVIDNPIGRTAEKALGVVGKVYDKVSHLPVINQVTGAMQGAIEPYVHNNDPASNEPIWKKYLGNVIDTVNLTHNLTNPTSLITGNLIPSTKDKNIIDKGKAALQAPKSMIQGAFNPDEARKNLEDSLKSKSLVTKLAVGSLADPLSYVPVPSIKGMKGISASFDRMFGKVKPIEAAPITQSGPVLGLPEPKSAIMAREAQNRSILPANTDVIHGQGDVQTLGLPEGQYTAPTRMKVNNPTETLDYVMTKIKPEVMSIIEAPTRRDLLIQYVQKNTQIPVDEIHNMKMTALQDLGQNIQKDLHGNMQQIAFDVAKQHGHDLPALLEGQAPTLRAQLAKDTQSQVYGVQPPKIGIQKPNFNVTHNADAAMPITKIGMPSSLREVAATTEVKPKVEPINGTVIKKEAVQPSVVKVEPITVKPEFVDPTKQKPNEKVTAERGHAQTLKESDKTPQEFKDNLSTEYTKLRNVDAVTQANKRISKSIDDAESYVMGNSKHSPEKVATAGRLIDEFNKSGNYDKAVTVAEKVSKELTEAGQTVQAASIFNRLTPEGALIRAQRKVTKINEEATRLGKPVEITARNAQDIKEAAEAIQVANVSKDRASDVIDIMDKLKAKQTITEAERTAVQDFIKDAQQYVRTKEKPIRERSAPSEMGEKRVKDKVVSFLDAQEAKAKERMAARRGRMNSLPLDEYADMAIIVAAKIARGTIKTADITAELVKDFGEGIKPHLAGVFQNAHDLISSNAKRISKEVVSQAERITENYIKKNEAHIKPEDVDFVRGLAKQVSDLSGAARNNASQDLQAVLSSFEKAGIGKKIAAVQYISMLLNPLTQVKNIVGNELLFRLNRLSRTLQTPADMIYSGITGKERTITNKSGPATWENFFAPTRDYLSGLFQGAKAGWRGVNIEGLTTSYDISGQAFRSKLNPLTYLEKTLGATMKGFDYAAFNRAVQQRLRETAYLDAINKGIKGKAEQMAHMDKYMANLDDNIAEIAHEFGKKITLQDTTLLSNKLQGMRGGLNQLSTFGLTKDFGVGSLVLPFAKTPANLLMRAIDYSPAGFGKAILQAGKILLKKDTDLTRADVIQSVTDAILGTGMTGVGLWFASKGVLKGETNSDRDVRELEKLSGITQYQLNASAVQRMIGAMVSGKMKDINEAAKIQEGDSLYQYEWAQPSSIPLALGANIYKERKDAKQNELKGQISDSLVKQTIDVSTGAANTLFNTSVLQGLQQAFDFNYGEDNKIKAFLTNIVKQAPSMFVPSMVGKVNQFQDSAVRETYSPNFIESVFNPSKAKISGQAQQLPQKVNTLGQPQTKESSIVDLFLNPATKTKYKPSPEAKEVMDLLSETGDDRLAPHAVSKFIIGKDPITKLDKKIMLTGAQLTEYQTIVGNETLRLLGSLPGNLTTEQKVKRVIDILSKAGEKGRKDMRKSLNLR